MSSQNKSHLTAVPRKSLPAPTQWLLKRGLLIGTSLLDYGCGKCHSINQKYLKQLDVIDGYDPCYRPDGISLVDYDTVICNYVLNVISSPKKRVEVIEKVLELSRGVAYITVRNDEGKLKGITKRGTWQGLVKIPKRFPHAVVHQTKDYTMYVVLKP